MNASTATAVDRSMSTTPTTGDVLEGLAAMTAVEDISVGKSGWNEHFSFSYATEPELFVAARKALAAQGLSGTISFEAGQHEIIPTYNREGQERPGVLATVTAVLTIRDSTGNSVECRAFGQGLDTADKAFAKAMTQAAKYLCMKALMIPVDSDDPDKEHTASVGGGAQGGSRNGGGAASDKQLGFVCSLIKKSHMDIEGDAELTALRLARMSGDSVTEFAKLGKQTASDLIERLQKIPGGDGPLRTMQKLDEWETTNGLARDPRSADLPYEPVTPINPEPQPTTDGDDSTPF